MEPEILQTQKERSLSNLQSLIDAGQLSQWMYELTRPYIKEKVLELWSGEGKMSDLFIQNGLSLRISDPHRANYAALKQKFEKEPLVKGVHRIDLHDPEFDTTYNNLLGKFDTVLSLKAIEKDTSNLAIVNNAKKLLQEGCRLIILLPAQTVLYEESEEGLEDLRRWNRRYIKDLLGQDGKILHFFSISEIPVSSVSRIFNDSVQPQGKQMDVYHRLVPIFPLLEKSIANRSGLYIMALARK